MRTAGWLRVLAVTALLASACGSVNPPAARNVATPSAAMSVQPTVSASASPMISPPAPSPTPAATPSPLYLAAPCKAPSSRRLALVTLRGSDHIVVRDITDISRAKTVSNLQIYPAPVGGSAGMEGATGQFVCETEISYIGGEVVDVAAATPTNIYRSPLSGPSKLVINGKEVFVFAWSRDGRALVYVTPALDADGYSGDLDLHQLRDGVDRVIGSMPPMGVGGCEAYPCPGPFQDPGDKWDFRLSYSSDEAFISVVYGGIGSFLRVWTSAGKLVSSDDRDANMSVWSGANLYFRDAKGVEVWHNGKISSFLPGVAWIRPKASPAGGQIVYETRDAKRVTHVFIVDTGTRKVRELASGRSEPAYLTSQMIWYQAEPACLLTGKCDAGFPGIASGSTYIYDLVSGTESGSIITSVIDGWPRGA